MKAPHKAYTVLDSWQLADYDGVGTLYEHTQSGAQIFHVANDDPENAFAFGFPTFPEDSTGVAHILEHTVLSGSERFPVKDPFLQLLKGSVNTFLNAMTFPDRTVYPAASPVAEDLFNMMLIYGDAVFFPLLKPELFRQEGHRLEPQEDGTLERTGIVYNEMKGNYSSHDSVAGERCFQSLFPDAIYRHDSGGDPEAIPHLTYEQFVAFHRRFYHPANARILLYGNIAAERYLSFLDDEFLSRFERAEPVPVPSRQPRWDAPRTFEATYPLDGVQETGRRSSVTLNWLLMPVTEPDRLLDAAVLTEILLGHSGSPLARVLLDSGLGQDLSPVLGLETELAEAVFSVGLRGTDPEHSEAIVDIVVSTLERLAREGLASDSIEAALRRVEFRNRELKSGPNGLRAMRRAMRTWMYGADPARSLNFSERIASLRERIEGEPAMFERLIRELLLENPHRSTVTVRPDTHQGERERHAVEQELAERAAKMTVREREQLAAESQQLAALQDEPDDPEVLASIPYLAVESIPAEVRKISTQRGPLAGARELFVHRELTNGIVYLDLAFDIGELSAHESALLNLFGAAITEVGLPGVPFERLNDLINLTSGGISAHVSDQTRFGDLSRVRRLLIVRTRALERTWREAAALMVRIITEVDFSDQHRMAQVIDELVEDMSSSLIPSGHFFAGLRGASALHGLADLDEQTNGISQMNFLAEVTDGEAKRLSLAGELSRLARQLCDPQRLSVNVTAGGDAAEEVVAWLPEMIATLEEACERRTITGADGLGFSLEVLGKRPQSEYLLTSASVAYVAHALRGFRHDDALAPAQDVLAHLLRTGLLWEKIRMRGGAYGAFAQTRSPEAIFAMVSYRDPHTAVTLQAYRDVLAELASDAVDEATLNLAKVSMLGRELRPIVPRDRGYTSFKRALFDVTDELRQQSRDALRAVEGGAVQRVARELHDRFDDGYTVVLGGQAGLDEWRETLSGPPSELTVTPLDV